jgi:prevent-host-death family protein
MCYMHRPIEEQVGVRELRQNLSVYLARIARGETLEVTDRGVPVAILAPLPRPASALDRLAAAGLVIRARGDLLDLPRGHRPPAGFSPAKALAAQRGERKL